MNDRVRRSFPLDVFLSEFAGTAALVSVGLSIVILMFGTGSPLVHLLPSEAERRAITGFLFGATGATIALSPVGKISGAHINPIVSVGFRLAGKLEMKLTLVYIAAQVLGGVAGSVPLLLWGEMGRSVAYGASLPGGGYTMMTVFLGEVGTTFAMVSLLTIFLAIRMIRPCTPALFPPLYSVMVWAEAPVSGTSTNPARSLGPALVAGQWQGWWIYWIGPLLGTLLALAACSFLARRIEVAKLYHFDSDRDWLFRKGPLDRAKRT